MVNPSKVLKARGSKRQSLKDKHKIAKKIREHHRKVRKDKRLNPQKYKKRDPGIPNSWPFKAQLLMQQQQAREDLVAYVISKEQRDRLYDAFLRGCSIRKSMEEAQVSKGAALRWKRIFGGSEVFRKQGAQFKQNRWG